MAEERPYGWDAGGDYAEVVFCAEVKDAMLVYVEEVLQFENKMPTHPAQLSVGIISPRYCC